MMLSSQAPPQGGVSAANPHQPAIHRLPPTSPAHQPAPQIAYEGRVSLMSPGSTQPWPHPQHFNQFNSLNFDFSPFKKAEGGGLGIPFPLDTDRETSPSSAGSPRTDDTVDKSSGLDKTHETLEKSFELKSSSEANRVEDEDREEGPLILDEEIDEHRGGEEYTTEEESSSPVKHDEVSAHNEVPRHEEDSEDDPHLRRELGGEVPPYIRRALAGDDDIPPMPLLSIRRDIGGGGLGEDSRNIAEDKGEDDLEEEEELRIDEEMEEEDRG